MTGPEHYREAERLAELAMSPSGLALAQDGYDVAGTAQIHATLALAAATVEAADQQIDVNYRRPLIIRPTKGDDVDPAFPGSPWGRALYGEVAR